MNKYFELRVYEDMENGGMLIEISKVKTFQVLMWIINFLERLRE